MLKKRLFLLFLFLGVAVAVSGPFLLSQLFDPETVRDDLEQVLSAKSERRVAVEGPMDFSFFPWFGLEVRDLVVRDYDTAQAGISNATQALLEAESVKIRIRVPSLILRREIVLGEAIIEKPGVYLHRDETGKSNWESLQQLLTTEETVIAESVKGEDSEGQEFRLVAGAFPGIRVKQGTVHYVDKVLNRRLDLTGLDLKADQGRNFDFAVSFLLRSQTPAAGMNVRMKGEGSVNRRTNAVSLRDTDLDIHGVSWAEPGRDGTPPMPTDEREAWSLTASLDYEGEENMVMISRWMIAGSGVKLTGSASGKSLGMREAEFSGNAEIQKFDTTSRMLSDALKLAGLNDLQCKCLNDLQGEFGFALSRSRAALLNTDLRLLDGAIKGRFDVRYGDVPEIIVRASAENFNLDAFPLRDRLEAELQQEAEEATSETGLDDSLKTIVGTKLQVDLQLRNLSSQGREIPDLRLTMSGNSKVTRGRLYSRDVFGGTLEAAGMVEQKPAKASEATGYAFSFMLDGEDVDIEQLHAFLRHKKVVTGTADLTIEADADGKTYPELLRDLKAEVTAAIQNGSLILPGPQDPTNGRSNEARKTSNEETAEPKIFPFNKSTFKAKVRGPGKDVNPKTAFFPTVPYSVDATVKADSNTTKVTANIRGMAYVDTEKPAVTAMETVRIRQTLKTEVTDYSGEQQELEVFGLMRGRWDGAADRLEFKEFRFDGPDLAVQGDLQVLDAAHDPLITGNFETSTFVPRNVMRRFGITPPQTRKKLSWNQCSIAGRIQGIRPVKEVVSLKDIFMTLDGASFSADVHMEDFDTPKVEFDLEVNRINADDYRAPREKTDTVHAPWKPDEKEEDEEPSFFAELLERVNARGTIRLGSFELYGFSGASVTADVSVKQGVLGLSPIQADFYEGELSGNLFVRYDPFLHIAADAEALRFRSEGMLEDVFDFEGLGGNADLSLSMNCFGDDYDARINSLSGKGRFLIRDGYHRFLGGKPSERLNRAPAVQSEEVVEMLQDTPDTSNEVRETRFKEASASVIVASGIIENNDLTMLGELGSAKGEGSINLPDWTLDYRLTYRMGGIPTIPAVLTGSLDDIRVNVKVPDMVAHSLGRIGGAAIDVVKGVLTLPFRIFGAKPKKPESENEAANKTKEIEEAPAEQ